MARRLFAVFAALIVAIGGIWIASAGARTDPQPTAPLGTWCPPVPSDAIAGQPVQCKVVADPDWTAPTPTSTTTSTTVPATTTTTVTPPTTTTTVPPVTTTTSTPPAGLMGWQLTPQNVGLAPHGLTCAGLELYLGPAKPLPGTTISRLRVEQSLDLSAGDILIEQSCLAPRNTMGGNKTLVTTFVCPSDCVDGPGKNVTIRDSEITGANLGTQAIAYSCAFDGIATLQRNYLHDTGSGICARETGVDENMLIENNYVRGLRAYGNAATTGSHNEAATIRDFRNATGRTVKFLNNRLDCSSGNETGGLFIQPTWLPIYNATIQGNYLEGGGYNLYLERTGNATYGNVRAINNRFRPTGWGPAATPSGPGYAEWRDNYVYSATAANNAGAVVSP